VTILWAGLIVTAGAMVQGTVGFGMALLAAPLLVLVDPDLVPVPLVVLGGAHAVLALVRERADADWRGVGWAMLGRLPGAVLGAAAVALLTYKGFATLIAVAVLVCAALSVIRLPLGPRPFPLLVAGVMSGVSGTAAGIGGPPLALLYQREGGSRVRSTLGAYFGLGAVLSLIVLGVGGQVDGALLVRGAALIPFMAVGFVLSTPCRMYLDRGWTRPAVVGLSAVSAVVLLVQAQLT
jgi:uncharacterized membrane protein YfcA